MGTTAGPVVYYDGVPWTIGAKVDQIDKNDWRIILPRYNFDPNNEGLLAIDIIHELFHCTDIQGWKLYLQEYI